MCLLCGLLPVTSCGRIHVCSLASRTVNLETSGYCSLISALSASPLPETVSLPIPLVNGTDGRVAISGRHIALCTRSCKHFFQMHCREALQPHHVQEEEVLWLPLQIAFPTYPLQFHLPRVTVPHRPDRSASCGFLTSGTPAVLPSLGLRPARSSSSSVI